METTVKLLQALTRLPGIPGREEAVANFLMETDALDATQRQIDQSGNVWIHPTGPEGPPLVLVAHMDEVGFKVNRIEEDGRLSIRGHRHFDLRTLGSEVMEVWTEGGPVPAFVFNGQRTGGPKDYGDLNPDNVRLDLGVVDRPAAEALGIRPSDPVTFDPGFVRLGGDVLCAKAFDNRSGLAAILRAIQLSAGKRKLRPVVLGTVQEEIGGHGADAVEFREKPGAVINVDICGGEVYDLPEPARRPLLGRGPIFHDGPECSRGMLRRLRHLAGEKGIPTQHMAAYGRGADQSILQKKSGGLPIFGVILPMAYYHGPRGLIHGRDVLWAAELISAALCDEEFLEHTSKF
jgi:endoglucanase